MKSVNKPKQAIDAHITRKTKKDFLSWLRKKEALKKQAEEGKTHNPPAPPRER
jgi:hypothetical protein